MRPLGHGGMASVHLALQESVQREVALKIMAPTLAGDPQFGERFLREARIAARLRHPHVVQVHDVGACGEMHYMAMEYLPGGAVVTRERGPRGLRFALRVTREMASALGYAHARGVIHRDIKPDNILLREDGAAVLTDFGIARANDNVRMTMTGSIMGTPSYMSPEQARGEELDGRSDLYSLGIVFYELLTGRVPYAAEDQISVGIMHLSAPLPNLPAELGWLDPLLHRLLAKDRARRLSDGGELAQELAEIEQRFTPTPMRSTAPQLTPPPQASMPQPGQFAPLHRASEPVTAAGHEPTLGSVDGGLIADRARPRRRAVQRRPLWPWMLCLLLVGAGAGVWRYQEQLRALLPQSQTAEVLDRAEQALAQGRLSDDATGSGARELFTVALAIDPDNLRARDGLARVGQRWLLRAEQAAGAGDVAGAEAALEQARQLAVPAARVDAVAEQLRQQGAREDSLSGWLDKARQARDEDRLDGGPDSALALYRQVLEQDPGNALARDGIGQVLAILVERARRAITAGEFVEAEAQIARVAGHEPAHPDLPTLRGRLAEARQAEGSRRQTALQEAENLLQRGRLTAPSEANALALFRSVLAESPDEERAKRGIERIAANLNTQFDRAAADYDIERAGELLSTLERHALLSDRALAQARSRLEAVRQRAETLEAQRAREADPQRLRNLLDQAAEAASAGNLWGPPGESAYDKYRQVQRAEPSNAEARQGLLQLPLRAAEHFETALSTGRLGRARGYVEGLESTNASAPGLGAMKRRLSQAYAGYAAERLGAGELQRARDGFEQALELDPDNAELVTLRARLEAAGG
nr:serine/threonine-protein kinase [Lysobacter sp. CAU 1642]